MKSTTILIIECNTNTNECIFANPGTEYHILQVDSYSHAINAIKENDKKIDAAILDGFSLATGEACEDIVNILSKEDIPYFAVLNENDMEAERYILKDNRMDYLKKPVSKELLQIKIHNILSAKKESVLNKESEISKRAILTNTILNNMAGGVTAVSLDGDRCEYFYTNERFFQIFKYTHEDFEARKSDIYSIFHPDDRARVRKAVESLQPGDGPLTLEYRAIGGDDSIINIRMVIAAVRHGRDEKDVQVSIFEDITEQVREEERQRELMDNLPCGAGIYDLVDGTLKTVYVNKKYRELVNRDNDKIEEESMNAIWPDDRAYVKRMMQTIINEGKEQECEIHILVGENQYKSFLIRGNLLKKENEKISIYVIYTPIAENEISYRNMMPSALEAVMAYSHDLSFIKDRAFVYVCASKEFATMLGIDDEKEIIGKTDYDLFEKKLADVYREDDVKLMESGKSLVDFIERIPDEDGKVRYSNTSKYILKDETGNVIGLYGIGRDITENREAYKRLQMLTDTIPGGLGTFEISKNGVRTL